MTYDRLLSVDCVRPQGCNHATGGYRLYPLVAPVVAHVFLLNPIPPRKPLKIDILRITMSMTTAGIMLAFNLKQQVVDAFWLSKD